MSGDAFNYDIEDDVLPHPLASKRIARRRFGIKDSEDSTMFHVGHVLTTWSPVISVVLLIIALTTGWFVILIAGALIWGAGFILRYQATTVGLDYRNRDHLLMIGKLKGEKSL